MNPTKAHRERYAKFVIMIPLDKKGILGKKLEAGSKISNFVVTANQTFPMIL